MKKLLLPFLILCMSFSCHTLNKGEQEPPLSFDKKFHSFGKVTMGEKLTTTYNFINTSDKRIKITELITTCGCTVADLDKYEYAPGERGDIIVTMDTTLKEGLITKTITLKTDIPAQPEIHLNLAARVKMPPHPEEKSVDIIMSDKCRLCHIEAGKGLTGGRLYHKICWQCHGDNMHPPSTVNIFNPNLLRKRTNEELFDTIAKGDPVSGMPRYLDEKENRGLTREQISSLIEFMRNKSKKGK